MNNKALVVIDIQNNITSYDLKKLPDMLAYYESKGCEVKKLIEYR